MSDNNPTQRPETPHPAASPKDGQDGSQFRLLGQRRFGPYFLTQFLGAFNDNVFKNALMIMIAFSAVTSGASSDYMVNLAAMIFILPYFLFSAIAGQLADKFEKSRLIRIVKLVEIVIMLVAAVFFMLGNTLMLVALLFFMGLQSTVFGPVKYGILPQTLKPEELVGGNGLVEMGTFLAILMGTILGGILIALDNGARVYVPAAIVILALLGYLASRVIPEAPPTAPDTRVDWNPLTGTVQTMRYAYRNFTVFQSILGISWFWLFGAIILAQLPNYTRLTLGGDPEVVTVLLTLFSLGIGLGSLLCERMSGHRVELGLVPLGSIGLTVFLFLLYWERPDANADPAALVGAAEFLANRDNWGVLTWILLTGLFGGFFIVPLYALIQQRTEARIRSQVIAANNIMNALFMVIAGGAAIAMLGAGLSIPQLFLAVAILNAAVALYIYSLVPEFLMRFIVWILINTLYRVRVRGLREAIPDDGPAVLVCNHVSYMDPLIIGGSVRRPVRFVMDSRIFRMPLLHFVFKTAKAIPIAPAHVDADLLERAYDQIAACLEAGDVVCIFPEGKITYDGELNEFRGGIEKIVERTPVPVVPMALRNLWGSFFSRRDRGKLLKLPRKLFARIELFADEPVAPANASAAGLRESVAALRGDRR